MTRKALALGAALALVTGFVMHRRTATRPQEAHAETAPAVDESEAPRRAGPSAGYAGAPLPILDRKRADALRDALHALYDGPAKPRAPAPPANEGAGAPRPSPRDYPEMPTGATADGGDALKQYIRDTVRSQYFPLANSCYQASLAKAPKLAGRIAMRFTILGDRKIGGVVDGAEFNDDDSTIRDDELRTCLRESMMSVAFDAPPGGGAVTVEYPVELSPDDEDGGPPG